LARQLLLSDGQYMKIQEIIILLSVRKMVTVSTLQNILQKNLKNYSTIPPFKLFFNIPVSSGKKIKPTRENKTAIELTKERLRELDILFQKFKND